VLQCVVVCCNRERVSVVTGQDGDKSSCVAVHSSVLQCVVVCCSAV